MKVQKRHKHWRTQVLPKLIEARKRRGWYQHISLRSRHFRPGRVIETCGCDIAEVILCDGDDLEYKSLTTGQNGSCSLMNCGPVRLNPVMLQRRMEIFRTEGKHGLSLRYFIEDCRMSREQAEKFMAEWK